MFLKTIFLYKTITFFSLSFRGFLIKDDCYLVSCLRPYQRIDNVVDTDVELADARRGVLGVEAVFGTVFHWSRIVLGSPLFLIDIENKTATITKNKKNRMKTAHSWPAHKWRTRLQFLPGAAIPVPRLNCPNKQTPNSSINDFEGLIRIEEVRLG